MGVRFPIQPRMVAPEKVARRLGVTSTVFGSKRAALEAAGFPKPDVVLGNYCLEAVDKWIDAQAGLTRADDPVSAQAAMLRAVRDKAWAK
ncbi:MULTISPECIES: hypothetical protein [unclassified Mesorhizobium]|uniref:hypothetical protein n=1 Tax=unclassified Mesorhizobium TaxID=325217 RepID=UPI000FC9D396|nr:MULTISPECIES: hypothetical protein [unclassified Mesorhizobium]RUV18277.1 hypothetical protein EOA91_18315 [Mesorhizobium sp. M1A.F.Ca.IN.022.04.1.1]RWG27084.1 MAG: hypothetical protein EOQ60_26185 [Mesorhizobium sp.]TIS12328.1 MAG: hypothetical protein E5X10_18115 [Mesorhizobium sp.]